MGFVVLTKSAALLEQLAKARSVAQIDASLQKLRRLADRMVVTTDYEARPVRLLVP